MFVEEKQLDGGGIAGEDREIDALRIDTRAEGMGSPGLGLERSQGCRLGNLGFPLAFDNGAWHGRSPVRIAMSH
jgi:hypothetical protein